MARLGSARPSRRPVRVAIVGGGCAGVAAAWELSKLPGYRVAVYEKGWRLGGKGASGRDSEGRIREHGLHIWLGFYENAFAMMHDCYAEVEMRGWGPYAPPGQRLAHGSMAEAFHAEPHIGVAIPPGDHRHPDDAGPTSDRWRVWSGGLPFAAGVPGTPINAASNPFTLARYIEHCLELLKALSHSVIGSPDLPDTRPHRAEDQAALEAAIEKDVDTTRDGSPQALVAWMAQMLRDGALTAAAVLVQAIHVIEQLLQRQSAAATSGGTFMAVIVAVLGQTRKQLRDVLAFDADLRLKTEIIDIVITIGVGLYRDRILFEDRGFDAINGIDYRAWLLSHGASPGAVDSRFITGIYDLAFAYRDGDRGRPQLAAGVALRGALRMFLGYRGAMFWRMRSGMGDAVFAPLYRVLSARGVQFHFGHALQATIFGTVAGQDVVDELHFDVAPDSGEAVLDHFGCWPHRDQPADGPHPAAAGGNAAKAADARLQLARGSSFDQVIFATGIDDFVKIMEPSGFFALAGSEWTAMKDNVRTVATQAAQVWLDCDLEQLGWQRGTGVVTAFEPPFETWADMSHTLSSEQQWRDSAATAGCARRADARSVAYFCGVLPENALSKSGTPKPLETVAANLDKLLDRGIAPFWPAAFADGRTASAHTIDTHIQANCEGSDRYTLSLPGSIRFRISPLDYSLANMTIAGDWTATGLDVGCVESAVMSGMLAAHAVTGSQPPLHAIVGYDHP